jgi:photosystem I subunit V
MAACIATAVIAGVPTLSVARKSAVRASSSQVSFSGRNMCSSSMKISSRSWESQTKLARSAPKTVCFAADTPLVISLSTGALLFLGRFVLLPFQRAQVAKAGLPEQNGVSHFEAGDTRAQEVATFLKTNDPAGFTIVDLLAWGALGHAVGFFVLATASNGYDPTF